MKKAKKGFTIVELVVVIAVIGILAAVLIPTFSGIIERAKQSVALQETKNTLTEYISQRGNADPGLMFYYPEQNISDDNLKESYIVFLYANGKLNQLGKMVLDNVPNAEYRFVPDAGYSTVDFKEDEEDDDDSSPKKGNIEYSLIIGSYSFQGSATFSSPTKDGIKSGYGEAYISTSATVNQYSISKYIVVELNCEPGIAPTSPIYAADREEELKIAFTGNPTTVSVTVGSITYNAGSDEITLTTDETLPTLKILTINNSVFSDKKETKMVINVN